MAQVESNDALQQLLSSPLNENDQDPNAALFARQIRNAQADVTMLPASSNKTNPSSNVSTNNMYQTVHKGSNNSIKDNTEDSMDTDMYTKLETGSPNASVLPQPRTLYTGGAYNKMSPTSPTSGNRPAGLRLSLSHATNAVTSVINAFAHGTPQGATSPPFSNEQFHGIASALSSVSSTSVGISIPDYSRTNQQFSSPSAYQHQEHGISKGLALASGFGVLPSTAGANGGGGYQPDSTHINNTPSDPGAYSSFSDPHPSMSTHRASAEDDDDALRSDVFSNSPFLQPHSRPLSPNSEGHQSPAAYPPLSPCPSPSPSPIALAHSDGGLSPAYSPGGYSPGPDGSGSGLEGDAISAVSPTSPVRGRLRGRSAVKHPKIPSQHPYSATAGSIGQMQQTQFVGVSPSRRSDAVESRHSRHRGQSVGEGYASGGSRGASPYPNANFGDVRRQSASALAMQAQTMLVHPHGSPAGTGIPPLEFQPHSASPSRDPSLSRPDAYGASSSYPVTNEQQQMFINLSYSNQYLEAPHSPHSPSFTGYIPVLPGAAGSPTPGPGAVLYPGNHYSPHIQSPPSLSPHSVQVPSLTPSPEIFGPPNVSGYPGSTHSSPALGLYPAGVVATSELMFIMDGNIGGTPSGQYPQQGYSEAQYTSSTSLDPTLLAQQPPNTTGDPGSNQNWAADPNLGAHSLTTERVEAAYGTGLGPTSGDSYFPNTAYSVQANFGGVNELQAAMQDPAFWQTGGQPTPGAVSQAEWGSVVDPNQFPVVSSSPPTLMDPALGGMMQAPYLEGQATQKQQQQQRFYNQQRFGVDTQTVPPSPAKDMVLPWSSQPDGQLPPGHVHEWQPYAMQVQHRPQQESIQQVLAHQPSPGGLIPPRPMPRRRRSKSDSSNQGHHPFNAGPSLSTVYDSPRTQQQQLAANYVMNFGKEEDIVLAPEGASVKMTKSLPTVTPKGGHLHHRRVPTVAVEDWDVSRLYKPTYPYGMYQAAPPMHTEYSQPGMMSSYQPPQPPPLNQNKSYPGDVTLGVGSSNLGRSTSLSKQKKQGQRNEVDEEKLSKAFTPGSHKHDPALRFFLEIIRNSRFYREDEQEPLLGSADANYLLALVRAKFPHDSRFVPRVDAGYERGQVDNETRDSQSIFMLFTENNECLICGQKKDRTGRALGHVRSDIGHRPYHCHCEKCLQSPNPRRFFSDNLLDDHLKGQMVKQTCTVCHNQFRRGGMKRHMESKHKEVYNSQDARLYEDD